MFLPSAKWYLNLFVGAVSHILVLNTMQSSAKSLMVDKIYVSISLVFNRNISGPNTVPWGTPDFTGTSLDHV